MQLHLLLQRLTKKLVPPPALAPCNLSSVLDAAGHLIRRTATSSSLPRPLPLRSIVCTETRLAHHFIETPLARPQRLSFPQRTQPFGRRGYSSVRASTPSQHRALVRNPALHSLSKNSSTPLSRSHLTSRPSFTTCPTAPRRNMSLKAFYTRWTSERPEPEKFTGAWWLVWLIRFTVFAITGSSSVKFVSPVMQSTLGIEGNWIDGPWSFRFASLAFVTPVYTVILLVVGTVFGQQPYFKRIASRMWSRLLPFLFKNTAKQKK